MGDLVVVVPGITGSVLRTSDREIWNLSAAAVAGGLLHTADTLERMRLPDDIGDDAPDDPRDTLIPDGLVTGVHIWPGFWAGAGYGRVLQLLRNGGKGVLAFAYDWRLSNRYTARLLATEVERALEQWRQQRGNAEAKLVFVCHSMGGLIARYYLTRLGGAAITRRVVTIGTPFGGSVKAIRALTGGLVPGLRRADRALVAVARTFPSVHQLLPTYRCVGIPGAEPVSLADGDLPDLPTAAIADALTFHDEVKPSAEPLGYEEHYFGGKRQPTDQSIALTPDGISYLRTQRGTDHRGDGTVASFASIPAQAPNSAAGTFVAARHAHLQRHNLLLDLVVDKVRAIDHGDILAPSVELALDLPDVVLAGEPVLLTVSADRPDLFLHARANRIDSRSPEENVVLEPLGDGTYTAAPSLSAGTWHVNVETVNEPLPAQVGDILVVA